MTTNSPGELTGFQKAVNAAQTDARKAKADGLRDRLRRKFKTVGHSMDNVPVLPAMDLLDLVTGKWPDRLTAAGSDGNLWIVPVKDRREPWFVSPSGHAALVAHMVAEVGDTVWFAWSSADTDEEALWRIL